MTTHSLSRRRAIEKVADTFAESDIVKLAAECDHLANVAHYAHEPESDQAAIRRVRYAAQELLAAVRKLEGRDRH